MYFLINSLGKGGAERVVARLSKYLKPSKIFLLERDISQKVSVEVVPLSNHTVNTNPFIKTFYIPFYASKLKRFINANDTVISFMERSNFVNILSNKKHKKILSVRTSITARKSYHPYKWFIKKLYPQADLIITNSRALEWEVKNYLNISNVKTIYNPVEVEEIKERLKKV